MRSTFSFPVFMVGMLIMLSAYRCATTPTISEQPPIYGTELNAVVTLEGMGPVLPEQ